MDCWRKNSAVALMLVVACSGAGCETLHNAGVPGMEPWIKPNAEEANAVVKHREEFLLKRDHKALYWLLSNRVSNGMLLSDVEQIIGEPGERENDTTRFKSDGLYQTTDVAYKWGPDHLGYSAVLFFRDGRVCNFNPKDFEKP